MASILNMISSQYWMAEKWPILKARTNGSKARRQQIGPSVSLYEQML